MGKPVIWDMRLDSTVNVPIWRYLGRLDVRTLRLAICGTPGTGKTNLCETSGCDAISVLDLALENDSALPARNDEPIQIDVEKLSSSLGKQWNDPPSELLLIDGHLSHDLPVDAVVVLRCRPDILRLRLQQRNWMEQKVEENVEYELLGGPWAELLDLADAPPCLELDTTSTAAEELWSSILAWLEYGAPHSAGEIDWIDELHS